VSGACALTNEKVQTLLVKLAEIATSKKKFLNACKDVAEFISGTDETQKSEKPSSLTPG